MQKSFIHKPISILLSLLMVLSVFGGMSLTAYATGTVTAVEFTVPAEWSKGIPGLPDFSESDFDGFQAVTEDEAKSWTGAPSSGKAFLIFSVESDGTIKGIPFSNGQAVSSALDCVNHKGLAMTSSMLGQIYYTTGITSSEPPLAYFKVTEAPDDWSGTYLIVYEDEEGNVAFNGAATAADLNYCNSMDINISDDMIVSSDEMDAATFTIAKIENSDAYSIRSASGYYIGNDSSTNNKVSYSEDTVYTNTISMEDGSPKIVAQAGNVLRYNSSDSVFRFYRAATYTNQAPIQLYKLTGASDPAVENVINLINAIDTVEYTDESKAKIDAAREAYDALTEDQQANVTNIDTLTAAEEAYILAGNKADFDQYKSESVTALENFATDNELSGAALVIINDAVDATNGATYDESKTLDENKADIDQISNNAQFNAVKVEGKDYCDSLALDGDSEACGTLIAQAKADIDALAYDSTKSFGDNLDALNAIAEQLAADLDTQRAADAAAAAAAALATAKADAKDALDNYVNADDYRAAEQTTLANAINAGKEAINAAESIDDVEAALAAAKTDIDEIKTDAQLTAEDEAAAAAANQAAAGEVTAKINAIGEVEYTDESKAKIDAARDAYDTLTDAQKALVENAEALTAAEARYAELKAAAETPDEPTPDEPTPDEPEAPTQKNDRLYNILSAVIELIKVLIIDIIPAIMKMV